MILADLLLGLTYLQLFFLPKLSHCQLIGLILWLN